MKLIALACCIVLPILGCEAEEAAVINKKDRGYLVTSFVWAKEDPANVPALHILSKGINPWGPEVARLYGDVSRAQWELVPYALRRLCNDIPKLPEKIIHIYPDKDSLKDPIKNIIYFGSKDGSSGLVFTEGEAPNNLLYTRFDLGTDWCKASKR